MKGFTAPGWIAALGVALGALLHPGLSSALRWGPASSSVLTALLLLLTLALLGRAREGISDLLLALGAATALLAAGHDALRGHAGTLDLAPGQAARVFDEQGRGGKPLGPRPLGFDIRLERMGPQGEAVLSTPAAEGGPAEIAATPERAAGVGGYRLGAPRRIARGDASRLRLAVSGSGGTRQVDVAPGEPVRLAELEIALERYFPDFALDGRNEPFSRSPEPRNPAALLQVRRGASAWRILVLRALPGIHRQQGLDYSFALVSVEAAESVRLAVAREPAAPLLGAGLLLAALGLALGPRRP